MVKIQFDTWDKYVAAWRCLKTMCDYDWKSSSKQKTVWVSAKDLQMNYAISERLDEIREGKWLYSY
jgi:outer membrane protease